MLSKTFNNLIKCASDTSKLSYFLAETFYLQIARYIFFGSWLIVTVRCWNTSNTVIVLGIYMYIIEHLWQFLSVFKLLLLKYFKGGAIFDLTCK